MTEQLPDSEVLSFAEAAQRSGEEVHLQGVQGSAPALLAWHARRAHGHPVCLVVARQEDATKVVDDLKTFDPEARCRALPTAEASPYESTRPDRSIALGRAATLSEWDGGRLDYLVSTAGGWLRKCVAPATLQAATTTTRKGDSLSLDALSVQLEQGGYQRVPLAEDPGTFAIRGDILDLWPPGRDRPVRLEIEFDTVVKLGSYNPETQRSDPEGQVPDELHIGPAREAVITPEGSIRARELVRSLCDNVSYPSSKARALIEDVEGGRLFMGAGGYLPALSKLEALSARLGEETTVLFVNPAQIVEEIDEETIHLEESYRENKEEPIFPPEMHVLMAAELDASLKRRRNFFLHPTGLASEEKEGFSKIAAAPLNSPSLGTASQAELCQRLASARKSAGRGAGLAPLVQQIEKWRAEDHAVVLCARVQTQVERLTGLLEHRGLVAEQTSFDPTQTSPGGLQVVLAPLAQGLVAPFEQLVLLTEEEIFGRRLHRSKRKASTAIQQALDDLRSLKPGDFVVHVEHGIGRYQGLEHRAVGDSAVDLLVVEYHGGDKLLLPVYRLNQVQKFSGEGAPKLDRLGGQTFAKTKSTVRKKVRIIADQLLRLYAERQSVRRPPIDPPGDEYASFEAAFPYEETTDQAAAITEVIEDLQKDTVMDRLVCGDVGFGKTEVALRAAFLAAHAGRQVALLCPTTVLAEQHLRTFSQRLEDSGVEIRGMSRFQSKKAQTETLAGLKAGRVDVVIGTHRLLSKDVFFKNLGLLIIDEEQRFGVTHKERLKELRKTVDVLTLSATPIPRTLSLAVGGMRDMSVITTPPQDRRSIRTFTARFGEQLVRDAVTRELNRGGQVFYVYNRVEGIYERASLLKRLIPGLRVAVGHGQMSEKELEKTMLGFVQGETDVLCATAIIESGLDIPRANTIIVDRADLFGLSQLYQLRGRVGRSSERAYCYLMVPPDAKLNNEAKARIETLERYTELGSGFHVATMDMEIRGAGELLGADQSGFMTKVGFELFSEMLEQATKELSGQEYVSEVDPELSIDAEALLPESYIEDIGVRLSLYKRYASASDENDILRLNDELADRFGSPPPEARRFAEVMRLKTELRHIRALGLTATKKTCTLHLRQDTPLSPEKLVPFLGAQSGKYALSPDGKLTRRAEISAPQENGLKHADLMLSELTALLS